MQYALFLKYTGNETMCWGCFVRPGASMDGLGVGKTFVSAGLIGTGI